MLNEYERERIRRAHYLEKKSIYRIAKEEGYSHQTIEKALFDPLPKPYHLSQPKPAPIFGPYQPRVEALLGENEHLPRKQRYTSHKIFEILREEGYQGSEAHLRRYLARRKKQANQVQEVFLPLEFEPGQDAQVDWGEAIALLGGQRKKMVMYLSLRGDFPDQDSKLNSVLQYTLPLEKDTLPKKYNSS
jgi:transposase